MNIDYKKFYNLEEIDFNQVEKCISKYSQKLSIEYLIYRILNAVKSIFGKSDWQKAKLVLVRSNPLKSR